MTYYEYVIDPIVWAWRAFPCWKMLGTDFYVFLLAMILAIVLLFVMVWHVS